MRSFNRYAINLCHKQCSIPKKKRPKNYLIFSLLFNITLVENLNHSWQITTHLKSIPSILIVMPMGQGQVISSPPGIHCGLSNKQCIYSYQLNTQVMLTARPQLGWQFSQWSGDCDPQGQVAMNRNKVCMATFIKKDVFLKTF